MGVSFVTGAASGIGAEIARRLAGSGPVCLLDRNLAGAVEVASAIASAGGEALALEGDVGNSADLARAVHAAVSRFGRLDVAVASAGVDTYGGFLTASEVDWDRVMTVNAKGVFLTAQATLPSLIETGAGRFIAIASDAGLVGCPGFSVYCASKHAVIGLVRSLACEFGGRGLRANCVCPAFVETPMSAAFAANASGPEAEYWHGVVPLKRFALPSEIAGVVDYLASPAASYVNGVAYAVDGGATAELHRSAA
ncbi:SDR family NAD(P)-dependent oxidoreductase [Shinella pollutisoli]|uniref:SDR family NAD(P)-dependent oxidoreductase n=1 Tax=Shinella pollutisoli TaxID=2250594 RepID=A0ABV7DEQ8_9HYPH|nr:SDR family NAD(P)-dependent oxidoreductase [Shinella pollutisoli]